MPTSTAYSQGDVCLVPFPFTNQEEFKRRPAIVVSASWYNNTHYDILLAAITSSIPETLSAYHVMLTNPDLRMLNLTKPCVIISSKIFAIEKGKIIQRLGRVSPGTRTSMVEAIKGVIQEHR